MGEVYRIRTFFGFLYIFYIYKAPYPEQTGTEMFVQFEHDHFDDGHDDQLKGAGLPQYCSEGDENSGSSEVSRQQPATQTSRQT